MINLKRTVYVTQIDDSLIKVYSLNLWTSCSLQFDYLSSNLLISFDVIKNNVMQVQTFEIL